MRTQLFKRGWLAAALLAAPACITLDDLNMPQDAGEDAASDDTPVVVDLDTPDAAAEVVDRDASPEPVVRDAAMEPVVRDASPGPAVRDAQVGLDAEVVIVDVPVDSVLLDSSMNGCTGPIALCFDTGLPGPDVIIYPDVEPFVCHSNAECGSDQYCTAGACRPTCNADGACVVHQLPAGRTVGQLASDDQALYFAVYDLNVGFKSEVWRREPGQAPTLVTDQLGAWAPFVVRDGYTYFRRGTRILRTNVAPQSAVEELYVVPGSQDSPWTIGDGFLVVSVLDGFWFGSLDGKQALRKIESELVGSPLQVTSAGDRFYFSTRTNTADHYEVTRVKSVRMVEPYAIENASPALQGQVFGADAIEVRPPYGYFGLRTPQRLNFLTGEVEAAAGNPGFGSPDSRFAILGDWLYYYSAGYPDDVSRLDRYFLGDPSISQPILPTRPREESSASPIMAVLGMRFYTAGSGGVYEMTLPAAPCRSNAQCSSSETCGPDAHCVPR